MEPLLKFTLEYQALGQVLFNIYVLGVARSADHVPSPQHEGETTEHKEMT